MRNLRIIELSAVIYAGSVNESKRIEGDIVQTDKGYQLQQIKCGGISFLFNILHEYAAKDTLVFCADRRPLFRIKIEPKYKANRTFNQEIESQKILTEIILNDLGFNLVFAEDYEADDCVYTLVEKYKNEFDHIYIHTSDSDLYMNVCENVSIHPVKKNDKTVNMQNYSTSFKKDRIVPYNTCNFYKMLEGDSTDNYQGLRNNDAAKKLLRLVEVNEKIAASVGNPEVLGGYIKALVPEAYDKFCLAYPQKVPVDIDIYSSYNAARMKVWGNIVCNRNFTNVVGLEEEIRDINKIIKNFFNGEYNS